LPTLAAFCPIRCSGHAAERQRVWRVAAGTGVHMTFRAKVPACAVLAAGLVIMPGCARGGAAVDADRGVCLVFVEGFAVQEGAGEPVELVPVVAGLMFLLGAHPAIAERAGRW